MSALFRRYGTALTALCVGITAFWLLMLVILPYFGLFEQSFRPYLPVVDIGGPLDTYSFKNYLEVFNNPSVIGLSFFGFDFSITVPIHLWVFFVTIFYSALTTLMSLMVCYPIAYYMAKVVSPKSLATLFLLLVIPMWVSEILRAFAWFIILALKGPLTIILQWLSVINDPIHWTWGLAGYSGVVIGLMYAYILFMLFPLYNAMSSLDSNQVEAAEDLGASWWRTHWRVIIPHSKPGIASGCVTVFMLSAGSVIVPDLLQSPRSSWFTQVIKVWMFESQDWQTGAAYAFMLLIVCTVFVTLMMKLFKVSLADIAK
jgi:spermidine/putrescine transport system permease protein